MEKNQWENEIDLLELGIIVLRQWYVLLLSIVFFTTIAYLYVSQGLEDVYVAQTSMLVLVERDREITSGDFELGRRLIETYTQLARSDVVINRVLDMTQLPYDTQRVRSMLGVEGVRDTIVIFLRVTHHNPEEAAMLANAAAVSMQEASLQFEGFDNLEILDVASVPRHPSGPNRLLYIAIGSVLGGMIGLFGIFFLEFLNRKIRTSEDIEHRLGLRLLAVIPYRSEVSTKEDGHV